MITTTKNRIGIIEVSEQMLENFFFNNKEFIPIEIHPFFTEPPTKLKYIKYLCYSEYFDVLKEGERIPQYIPSYKFEDNGKVTFIGVEKVK